MEGAHRRREEKGDRVQICGKVHTADERRGDLETKKKFQASSTHSLEQLSTRSLVHELGQHGAKIGEESHGLCQKKYSINGLEEVLMTSFHGEGGWSSYRGDQPKG